MDLGLRDKVVLVTGSSSGIGQAAAVAFAGEGARVVHYDLADLDSVRSAAQSVQKEWGALNVLVNNAVLMSGPGPTGKPFEDLPIERWQDTLRGNLEGIVLTINCALPLMRQVGWGRIVSISSDAVDGWPGLGPYATVKAGLHGLSRTMAKELSPAGISEGYQHVNDVANGQLSLNFAPAPLKSCFPSKSAIQAAQARRKRRRRIAIKAR